ncbi:MAG TPA: hypothetical protein PKV15_03345 [Syntrophomonadaceae bacterium]|jgi:hypothetical protein|nr:hypothetical protein [Syntrophomonadaceae bacterium]HRX21327.1 hypothetical protein [Syntrophomonadaceae bacterium]
MDCPNCKIPLNQEYRCLTCDFDVNDAPWVIIKKVYAPNELIIKSVLESYGIPVKIASKEVAQMPVSIGPLAEVKIAVPESEADTALELLEELSEDS